MLMESKTGAGYVQLYRNLVNRLLKEKGYS